MLPIIILGAVALVAGSVWATVRHHAEAPPPAPLSLGPDQRAPALPRPGAAPPQTFAVIGDDFARGVGAGWAQGWVLRLSDQLCWNLTKASVQPGSGFLAALQPGAKAYPERLDDLGSEHPGVILVQGGANDYTSSSEDITAAADATFKALKERNPDAKIVAIGPVIVPHRAEAPELVRVSGALAAAAAGNDVMYVDPVAEQWLDDDSLFAGVVPNADGYTEYTRRLAADLTQGGLASSCAQPAA
ncbi:SGNH/GDSL hydrolase family protein [Mycolicibacterium sp.]|uniref:SGNH/GDSL hydrolase family protein n=1 Tax=Mycolicibacterium sp. TaxID=2320850 RepID=UPI001A24C53D|nr:SGNH/GDSL hydrolase family protein [Mycolicibacterium sp.]MBJ7339105.1 SGNH/GDSL hydrolase family protein [Mycolicibacterium sp.]